MCTTCGCGQDEARIEGEVRQHEHRHADGTQEGRAHPHDIQYRYRGESGHSHFHVHADGSAHSHSHAHDHGDAHEQSHLQDAHGCTASHDLGLSQARIVQIEQDLLAKNDDYAARNRRVLHDLGIFAVNLVSSPGSGKTTLLVHTIEALRDSLPICVIEGDQQTSFDADRIRATGAPAIQVNTGKGCHLDASMVGRALERLGPKEGAALMIENVGNLVCPAGFDLGEAHKVVVLSVTEGEDKPLKYPDMFRAASLMLLNKIDLLPHLQFDRERCIGYARRINPDIAVLSLSAITGQGMGEWLAWIREGASRAQQGEMIDWLKPNAVSISDIRS